MPWALFRSSSSSGAAAPSSLTAAAPPVDDGAAGPRPSAEEVSGALVAAIADHAKSKSGVQAEAVHRRLAVVLYRLEQAVVAHDTIALTSYASEGCEGCGPAAPPLQSEAYASSRSPRSEKSSQSSSSSFAAEAVVQEVDLAVAAERREEGRALIAALLAADVPALLVDRLEDLCFETRKDAMRLFSSVLKTALPLGADAALVEYIRSHPRISQSLLDDSGRQEVFMHCAQMLRACTRYTELVTMLANQGAFCRLTDLACHETFDISSEAFSSLRELMLSQKPVSAAYMSANFSTFFSQYHRLLRPECAYVTRRQALRLLGDALLDRAFMEVMLTYVSNEQFLQIHMNLLRDSSRAVQVDAFHVFKIFVANPNKPYKVIAILCKNRERLLKLLYALANGSGAGKRQEGNSKHFQEDLLAIMEALKVLELPERLPRAAPSAKSYARTTDLASPVSAGAVGEIEEAALNMVEAA